jgi:N-acetylmuramoyl-L-alanine amidase
MRSLAPLSLMMFVMLMMPLSLGITTKVIDAIEIMVGVEERKPRREYTSEDYLWMAKNVYFEAANQSPQGRLAVIFVTLNRLNDERWPKTIKEVVTQHNARGCQFSWYCDGKPDIPKDKQMFEEILEFVKDVLPNIDNMQDVTDGAVFYHAHYVRPPWARHKQRVAKIEDHIFYK